VQQTADFGLKLVLCHYGLLIVLINLILAKPERECQIGNVCLK